MGCASRTQDLEAFTLDHIVPTCPFKAPPSRFESTPIVPNPFKEDQESGHEDVIGNLQPVSTSDACCMTENAGDVMTIQVGCNTELMITKSKATQCIIEHKTMDKKVQCSPQTKHKALTAKPVGRLVYMSNQETNTDTVCIMHKTTQVHPQKFASKSTRCDLYDGSCDACEKTFDLEETWYACSDCSPYTICGSCFEGKQYNHKCSDEFETDKQTFECDPT